MFKIISHHKKTLAIFCLTFSTPIIAGNCPSITVKDLSKAACSSKSAPFSTGALSEVKFYATTPCPTGIGIAKKFQSFFKDSDKEYPPKEKDVKPGEAKCTYSLDDTWKRELNTESSELILTVSFPTREHANYWYAPMVGMKCPTLSKESVSDIKKNKFVLIKERDPKLTYQFLVGPLVSGGISGSLSGSLSKLTQKTPALSSLQGKPMVSKKFEATCQYTHHTGGKESLLELKTLP